MYSKYLYSGTVTRLGESALPPYDKANYAHPITSFNITTHLPDFTKMTEMHSSIYRVNTPGYFFRCPRYGSLTANGRTGVVIDAWNHLMGTIDVTAIAVIMGWVSKSESDTGKAHPGISTAKGYKLGHGGETFSTSVITPSVSSLSDSETKSCYVSRAFEKYQCLTFGNYIFGGANAPEAPKNSVAVGYSPATHTEAVRANQRMIPETFDGWTPSTGNLRLNYFVGAGKNNAGGGIANSLIPIVPGVASDPDITSDSSYSPLTEYVDCVPAMARFKQKRDKDQSGDSKKFRVGFLDIGEFCRCDTGADGTNCMLEAMGTYVFYYKNCEDMTYFVPIKSVSQGSTNFISEIRSVQQAYSCTYNLPEYQLWIDNQINATGVLIASADSGDSGLHEDVTNLKLRTAIGQIYADGSVKDGTMIVDDDKDHKGTIDISGDEGDCNACGTTVGLKTSPSLVINSHKNAFDIYFRTIFKNSKITGHKKSFKAQILSLVAFDGTPNGFGTVEALYNHVTQIATINPGGGSSGGGW